MSGYSSTDDRRGALMHGVHIDAAVARKAALHVAGRARDAEDCRLLLDILGLNGRPLRSSRNSKTLRNTAHKRASRERQKESP